MKCILSLIFVLTTAQIIGQTKAETEVLQFSKEIFRFEVANKIDSLADLLHEKLVVVNSKGETQNKAQFIATFKSGSFLHNSIDLEETVVTVVENTATVAGKGLFNITAAGNTVIRHLSYLETFIQPKSGWKLLALKASVLPN